MGRLQSRRQEAHDGMMDGEVLLSPIDQEYSLHHPISWHTIRIKDEIKFDNRPSWSLSYRTRRTHQALASDRPEKL
jgi:hypothetical protein